MDRSFGNAVVVAQQAHHLEAYWRGLISRAFGFHLLVLRWPDPIKRLLDLAHPKEKFRLLLQIGARTAQLVELTALRAHL